MEGLTDRLLLGGPGRFFQHLVAFVGVKKHRENSPKVSLRAIFKCYLFRYLTVLAALCIVYRSVDLLVGTALGLVVSNTEPFSRNTCRRGERQ